MSTPVVKEVAESTTQGDERPSKKIRGEENAASTSKQQLMNADLVVVRDFSDASDRSDDEDDKGEETDENEDTYDEDDDSEEVSDDNSSNNADETEEVAIEDKDRADEIRGSALPDLDYSSDDAESSDDVLDSSDLEENEDNEHSDVDVDTVDHN